MTPNVRLRIEQLVLEGVAGARREHVARALEAELARLIRARGLPPSLAGGGHVASLDAGQVTVRPGASAEGIGAEVARAVYGGLGK